MIWFCLGREYKLSIAEILAVFPKGETAYFAEDILIMDNLSKSEVLEKSHKLWWVIKIIEICEESITKDGIAHDWKFKYWISVFWEKKNLKEILLKTKKTFKADWISSRFINKDFKNLSSAQILWEKLLKNNSDYNYIFSKDWEYFWKTIWIQDINAYSKRDYSKSRDMFVWMLPPKLSQMMLNIAWWKNIFDPFVWLWTVLIEAVLNWSKCIYWSDLSEKMVESTENNLKEFTKENNIMLEDFLFEKLNAKFIDESSILKNKKIDSIVTEWYLWEIMTQKNISLDRIEKQKLSLESIYDKFFSNLKKINFSWNIVISFPFWELKWKYVYLTEVYEILEKYCDIKTLLPKNINISDKNSLLYKREKQLVGREIFKLKIK